MPLGRNIQKTLHFSFHVGLLVIMLSSLKLHTENNTCVFLLLTGSVTSLPVMQFQMSIEYVKQH